MSSKASIAKLRRLQTEVDGIRSKLGISAPSALLYLASLDTGGDELVVVEADGFGGAMTSIVEGNYPIDYLSKHGKAFDNEQAACEAAAEVVERRGGAETVLA